MHVADRRNTVSIEVLESRVLFAAHTWTGAGGNANWSTASNWTGGAPAAAESNLTLDFPNVSNTTANNDISGLTIQAITIEANYDLFGQGFSLAGSISATGGGGGALDNSVVLAADSTLSFANQVNMGGVISGSSNLQLNAGTVYLSGNNTYTGITTVSSGLIYLGSNTGLGSTSGGTVVDSGGAIMLDLGITCAEPLTLSGNGVSPGGLANAALFPREAATGAPIPYATWSGPIILGNGAAVAGRPASDGGVNGIQTTLDITGAISGSGNLTVANGGVTLTGVNSFTGDTMVNGGALMLNASGGASIPGNLVVASGASAESKSSGQLTAAGTANLATGSTLTIDANDTVGSLTGTGTLNGAGTLIVDAGGTDSFTGAIDGSVSLGMGGNGELIIGGSSTDSTTGQISISHGTLLLNASLPNAALNQTGGELAGGGTVASFNSSGGNIEPGSFNPGALSVTGAINLAAGSNYDWIAQDGSTYASLSAGGAVTIAGNFYVANLGSGFVPATGTVFTAIHNGSSSAVSGTFSGMPEGQIFAYQNRDWQVSYVGGSGHDVTLTYLGFPTTIAASATSQALGQTTLQAIVSTGVSGAPTPTGTVTFKNGTTVLGTAAVDNSGTATFQATSLPLGSYSISALYSGDVNCAPSSTSTPFSVTVMPGLSFGNASVTRTTGNGTADFTLTLNTASGVPVTVNYATQDGTALAGRDYQAASGTVTFAPGQTSQTVAITTLGGSAWEPNLNFSILYSSVSNAAISTSFSTATIQSTDAMPAAGLIPDELDPTQTDLVVYAPAGHDVIQVKPTKIAGQVQVVINRVTVATDSGLDRVIIYGGAGSNTLTVNPRIGTGVIFFGGAGRNVATGGSGNDILVGGSGPNVLVGGRGMNLLIGGPGRASLAGNIAGNVLVGGATQYDGGALSDILSLETLLSTWTSGAPYADRAAALAAADAPTGATLGSSAVALNATDHPIGRKNHDLVLAAVVTKPVHAAR